MDELSYECPSCGSTQRPAEVKVGDIVYFNCKRCDFSTWHADEYSRDRAVAARRPATDEEIERSFDAYR